MKKLSKFSIVYWYYQLVRQRGSSNSIAMGVAIGLFIGFLIPIGGQMAIAITLAFLLKASKIPALACTWITNPYTITFIYPIQCYIGSVLIGSPLAFSRIVDVFKNVFKNPSWQTFLALGQEFIVPFFVGGFTFGALAGFIGYFTAYGMIEHHRLRKKQRLNKKLSAVAHRDPDQ